MEIYIYKAAYHCSDCIKKILPAIPLSKVPPDPLDETAYDSDDYPKGPYESGIVDKSDTVEYDSCGTLLCIPLTGEGYAYLYRIIVAYLYMSPAMEKDRDRIEELIEEYDISLRDLLDYKRDEIRRKEPK